MQKLPGFPRIRKVTSPNPSAGAQNDGAAWTPSSFQSAALPTELPGRAMQRKNLADSGGRWQWTHGALRDRLKESRGQ